MKTLTNEQLLNEIRETNLAYLMLAQRMIREDRAQALFRLGLSDETADLIGGPTFDGHKPNAYIDSFKVGLKGNQKIEGGNVVGK